MNNLADDLLNPSSCFDRKGNAIESGDEHKKAPTVVNK